VATLVDVDELVMKIEKATIARHANGDDPATAGPGAAFQKRWNNISPYSWTKGEDNSKRKKADTKSKVSPTLNIPVDDHVEPQVSSLLCPGDVLNIAGGQHFDAVRRLGSSGGYMGHVLVVVGHPTLIKRQSSEGMLYQSFWPVGVDHIWRLSVIESCSSMPGLHETGLLLYVRESRLRACGEDDGTTVSEYEEHDDIHVWCAPSTLRGSSFRIELMDEVLTAMRACQHNWSISTAVRAYLLSAELSQDSQWPNAMQEVEDAWTVEPICTSIVVIFWQRYLQKLAKSNCEDPLTCILQHMPLRADRVLPGELLVKMLSCGWSTWQVVPAPAFEQSTGE
jgi:hypothetical protein